MTRFPAILVLLALCLSAYGNPQQDMLMRRAWGVRGAVPSVDLTPNLLHFWSGANGTNDTGSAPQTFTIYGTTTTSSDGWDFGTADGNYNIFNGPISNGKHYTISAWVKPYTVAMQSSSQGGWLLVDRTTSVYGGYDFALVYVPSITNFQWRTGDRDATVSTVGGIDSLVNSNWVNIAVVVNWAQTNQIFYQNGIAVSTSALGAYTGGPVNNSTTNATMATGSWDLGQPVQKYRGMADRVRFYGTNKPPAFIQAIFNTEKASKGL